MRRGKKRAPFHLDIAPINLIDLLLVLLIFFVTTTTFLQLKVIEFQVPHAVNNITQYKKDLTYVISIKKDCALFLDDQKLTSDELAQEIKKRYDGNAKSLFQIASNEDAPYRCFINVLDSLKGNGIENISILTKPKEK